MVSACGRTKFECRCDFVGPHGMVTVFRPLGIEIVGGALLESEVVGERVRYGAFLEEIAVVRNGERGEWKGRPVVRIRAASER